VGLLTWAQNTAFFPLQLVAIVSRVTFPLYSRMQEDRKLFVSALEGSVQLTCVVTLGMVGTFLGLGENLIHVIFTDKWMPALPLFFIFSLGIAMGFLMPLVATALDATGRAGVTLRVTILVTAMIWVLVPIGTHFYDATGFATAYAAVMWVGNIIMIVVLKRVIPGIRLWRRVRAPIVAMLAMVVVARFAVQPWSNSGITLLLGVLAVIVVFLGTLGLLDPAAVNRLWQLIGKRRK
jgi:O-antigen/teichoic acid export membrane protein